MQPQLSTGTAYIFWCLILLGFGGCQRLYAGKIGSGLLYLFTGGLFGIGQLIDLVLIPGMVNERNIYLRGKYSGNFNHQPTITLNLGDIPNLNQMQATSAAPASKTASPMQKLLRAAKEHGGTLSIAQVAMATELEPEEVKNLLQEAQRLGYTEISNDSKTGAIRYHFDV